MVNEGMILAPDGKLRRNETMASGVMLYHNVEIPQCECSVGISMILFELVVGILVTALQHNADNNESSASQMLNMIASLGVAAVRVLHNSFRGDARGLVVSHHGIADTRPTSLSDLSM